MEKQTKKNIIKARVNDEVYNGIKQKCEDLGINVTQLIEKIGREPVVFLDKNAKLLLKNLD